MAADPLQIAQGLESWGVMVTIGHYAFYGAICWVAFRCLNAANSIIAVAKLFFPDGIEKEPVKIATVTQVEILAGTLQACQGAQNACLRAQEEFHSHPSALCEHLNDCPAIKNYQKDMREDMQEVLRRTAETRDTTVAFTERVALRLLEKAADND